MIFSIGDKIKIAIGGEAIVKKELGNGGQGRVYLVSYNNKDYALKWYHKPGKEEFYTNLKKNIESASPATNFLWPLFLTERDEESNCYGYIMELRDSAFKDFGDFLLAKEQFKSVSAMIEAAIKICVSFRSLHNKGYSYQDLNDGNFFINPENGNVLICDNDNIAPSGKNTGILGKCRYMAPEVVLGKTLPDSQSDRFSLSIILFLMFFNNHPLEGELISSCPCMTEKHEKKFYGSSPVFIYDESNSSNRPVKGIHINVINLWEQFPKYLRDVFKEQFSQKTMSNPGRRISEKEWLDNALLKMRHQLIKCPYCGSEIFQDTENDGFVCDDCSATNKLRYPILESDKYKVVISKDKLIYKYITDRDNYFINTVTGIVIESKKNPGIFGLTNKTIDTWIYTNKNGDSRPIEPEETAPMLIGSKISFGNSVTAKII